MLAIISPAKTLDFESSTPAHSATQPRLVSRSGELIDLLREKSAAEIAELMKLSQKLSELNFERYREWSQAPEEEAGRSALFAFKGDVYTGLDALSLSAEQLEPANKNLRILSGLYGLLRPFDTIMPHRLEMGTKLENPHGKNLYHFWDGKITELLNADLKEGGHQLLVNLASQEYFKSVKRKEVCVPIIDCEFLDWKNGKYKVISFYAKKARGLFARFIIESDAQTAEDLKEFDKEGYAFCAEESTESKMIFKRRLED